MHPSDGWEHRVARVTALNPALVVDTERYVAAVLFEPDGSAGARDVVSFTLDEDITSAGGDRKRLVLRRAFQRCSYLRTNGLGDSMEVEYQVLTGGNVCEYHEGLVIASHLNDDAIRGTNRRTRATPGNVVFFKGRRYTIVEANAFAVAPDAVRWDSDEPLQSVGRHRVDCAHILIGAEPWANLGFFFDPDAEDDLRASYCFAGWRGSASKGECTRRVFSFEGDPLPDYYPANAQFALDQAEYHYSALDLIFRFSLYTFALHAEATWTRASAWHGTSFQGVAVPVQSPQFDGERNPIFVRPTSAAAGYGSAGGDEFVGVALPLTGSCDQVLTLLGGVGAVELRQYTQFADAVLAAVVFNFDVGSGIVGTVHRATEGGSLATDTPSTPDYSAGFQLRVQWSAGTVQFSHRAIGAAAWTLLDSFSVPNVSGGALNIVTSDAGGALFDWVEAVQVVPIGIGEVSGETWTRRIGERPATGFSTAALPSDRPIVEVRNMTTDTVMSPFTTVARRDVYNIDTVGERIVFAAEASGDLIRVTTAPPTSAGSGTGRPPRVSNQVNWATAVGDGSTSSTNANENRANWRDEIIVEDPLDTLDGESGETGSVRGDGVFDAGDHPSADEVQYSIRGRTGGETWTTLSSALYRAYWPDGLLLLHEDIFASLALGPTESLCLRVRGKHVLVRGGMIAANYRDLARMLNAFDQAWVDFGQCVSGSTVSMAGITSVVRPVVTDYLCQERTYTLENSETEITVHLFVPQGVAFGTIRNAFHTPSDTLTTYGKTWPLINLTFDGKVQYMDLVSRTILTGDSEVIEWCGPEGDPYSSFRGSHDDGSIDDFFTFVYPFDSIGPSAWPFFAGGENWRREDGVLVSDPSPPRTNFFGSLPAVGIAWTTMISFIGPGAFAEFEFAAQRFIPADWLAGLPDGATVLEAYILARFQGFRVSTWRTEVTIDPEAGGWQVSAEYYQEGELIGTYDGPDNGSGTTWSIATEGVPPSPRNRGAVTFALYGVRKDSGQLELVDGGLHPVSKDRRVALGSGVSVSEVEDGEWTWVNIAGSLNKIIGKRNSLFREYLLVPTLGEADTNAGASDLGAYLESLFGEREIGMLYFGGRDNNFNRPGYIATTNGRYAWCSSFEVRGSVLGRLRFPDGIAAETPLAMMQPPI